MNLLLQSNTTYYPKSLEVDGIFYLHWITVKNDDDTLTHCYVGEDYKVITITTLQ